MSNLNGQAEYRWLKQQGGAFGAPGMAPCWTSSEKEGVGTAYSASSRVWYTLSHGILNEVYYPTIDSPQIRDLGLLVSDGEGLLHEDKRDLRHELELIDPDALGFRVLSSDPAGRYRIVKEIIADPHQSVVLLNVRMEGEPELLRRLRVYALAAPHLGGGGRGNNLRAVDMAGRRLLLGWRDSDQGRVALSLAASCGFDRVSCGYVGASDGWQDLHRNTGNMRWEYGEALDGNVAGMGEIVLARLGPEPRFTIALAFGNSFHAALSKAVGSLAGEFGALRERFLEQWHRAASPEHLAKFAGDGGKLMRLSHNILLAHEDKLYSGAFIASASIPWGQFKGDDDLGGYHLVWTRDMSQTAGAMLASDRADTALRALVYLACTQRADGGFAQNFWIDGRPYWKGIQLDEVAFPILLAWRLWKQNALGNFDAFPFVERAAGFLVRHAPVTEQERWEENAGYSPSTLAVVISALICAGEMMRARGSGELATFLEEFADWIESHLEEWTVTEEGVLVPEVRRHYMRIRPPFCGERYAQDGCDRELLRLANRPPGSRYEFEAREIIDAGFLELVRYGVRRADDPLIVDSLKVVDAVLKRETPAGPCWRRYNHDGYGQNDDGGPYLGSGVGRAWPLLGGERAHYELAAGREIGEMVRTYERFASAGNLLPEQVWDADALPEAEMFPGRSAGSAVPLVWAHAEYLKLLRSLELGRPFDRVEAVYERYCCGRKHAAVEIFREDRPVKCIKRGQTLRIVAEKYFEAHIESGEEKTIKSRSVGDAGFTADIAVRANMENSSQSFTLDWPEENRRARYDVRIEP